jgi:hypothetical protein
LIGVLELLTEQNDVKIAPKRLGLKLDFGSGDNIKHGFEGVDLYSEKARWKQNLFDFPWPWGDGQVAEIWCSHFIEHIPMLYWDKSAESLTAIPNADSIDLFLKFFDECYRVLQPGGKMTCIWPCNRNDRAFQDPTHRRFIPPASMLYLNKKWREMNMLGHYLGDCNFTDGKGNPSIAMPLGTNPEFELFSPEATARRLSESWNVIGDWHCVLIKTVDV